MNVASIPDIQQKNAVISSYLEVNCKQMDRAAGAQYPSLDIPMFSALAFCKKHLPQKNPQYFCFAKPFKVHVHCITLHF